MKGKPFILVVDSMKRLTVTKYDTCEYQSLTSNQEEAIRVILHTTMTPNHGAAKIV